VKIKLKIDKQPYPFLDMDLMKKEITFTADSAEADYFLCKNIIPPECNKHKTILIITEPPLSSIKIKLYESFDLFHTVICFNPDKLKSNQFPFREDYAFFPHLPLLEDFQERKNTTLTKRKIFYAGRRSGAYEGLPNRFDTIPIYDVRKKMVEELSKNKEIAEIIGLGWEGKAKEMLSTQIFRGKKIPWKTKNIAKIHDINELNADFVLCIENCIQKGYVSEKIHDGFNSDRVVLYLGEPEIEKYVPIDCFIDLRNYFDTINKELNMKKIIELTQKMTQEEYDGYIKRARAWRNSIPKDGVKKARIRLTNLLISRIKGDLK
jgi:hypothetical protein